jgi:hypothetical protein
MDARRVVRDRESDQGLTGRFDACAPEQFSRRIGPRHVFKARFEHRVGRQSHALPIRRCAGKARLSRRSVGDGLSRELLRATDADEYAQHECSRTNSHEASSCRSPRPELHRDGCSAVIGLTPSVR